MPRPKLTFWPLRVIAALSVLAPALIFSYATWQNQREIKAQADERIERALDVLQEHALKSLQTVERSISEVNEVLRDVSDDAMRANEPDLYLRLKRTQQALPQIESIWVFDKDGRPLVSSTILPVPRELDNSDRSYFAVQKDADAGTYISEVVDSRVGTLRFFVLSGRRQGGDPGRFQGVVAVTVMPQHFIEFYRKLSRGRDSFALVRDSGTLLARYPDESPDTRRPSRALSEAIARDPEGGLLYTISSIDGQERRVGYRRVPGYGVYVTAAIEAAALTAELRNVIATQLLIGLPAVLVMFVLSIYALRRAQLVEAEASRREIAEAALKQAQRLEAIGQLTGGVAHDFNNLLMVVSGNIQRLKRYMPDEERARRAVDAIQVAVKRGADLTRQLLSFSRRQTHEARVLDLKERIPAIQEMLQSSLRGDIAVEARIPDGLWYSKVDISEFELALLNLAVNARDAMSGGGRLIIFARNVTLAKPNAIDLAGDFIAVSVQDTGAGIAPEILNRVFEPFFTTKDVGKGTGLGLSQVYGFAKQAGGTAVVDSAPGKGTTVTLYLPRTTEVIAGADAPSHAPPVTVRGGGCVLLVEDNADVGDVTRGMLEEFGYTVLRAADVPSALSLLRSRQDDIDAVLSDIVMPGGANGLDLARWVRQEVGDRIPIILATGYSDKAQVATDEGFPILRKPYDAAELEALLADALRKARKRDVA